MLRVVGINIHPDDMEISCGGTLAKYSMKGHEVIVLNLAQGLYLRDGRLVRHNSEENACKILGAKAIFHDFKPKDFWYTKDKVEAVTSILSKLKPDIVICPKPDDPDPHHRAVAKVVTHSLRSVIWGSDKDGYYAENYWMQTPFRRPDILVDISETIDLKVKAVLEYNLHKPPEKLKKIERGLRFWAAYRGNCCGVKYAEAFIYTPLVGKPQWPPSDLLQTRPVQLILEIEQKL